MIEFFIGSYRDASWLQIILEALTFVFGIASVWYAKKENILVYPTGLIATTITVYLLYIAHYYGDMVVNAYYSVMSIYGWVLWARKRDGIHSIGISRTGKKEKLAGFAIFILTIIVIFAVYHAFHYEIKTENYFDIFTSAIFFTAMWFMALKKIENWTLWIVGDILAIPLYAYRGLGILSLEYVVFTILAIMAYIEWRKIISGSSQHQS